jgi:hypothetical protein
VEVAPNPQVLAWIFGWLALFLAGAASVLKSRTALQLENVALRHQISPLTLREEVPHLHEPTNSVRPAVPVWADWRSSLVIVNPKQSLPATEVPCWQGTYHHGSERMAQGGSANQRESIDGQVRCALPGRCSRLAHLQHVAFAREEVVTRRLSQKAVVAEHALFMGNLG